MKKLLLALGQGTFLYLCFSSVAVAEDADIEQLRQEIKELRGYYEKRIDDLEKKLDSQTAVKEETLSYQGSTSSAKAAKSSDNSFNPQLSVILDGKFASYKNDPEAYELPGFALGGEAGLASEGFSLGHSEITASANIDDKFYGQLTLAIAEHDGETETELEEAFFETLGLGAGFTVKGGRFFSGVGYLNQQHEHAWDFADAPLIYGGLWGNKYLDDGVRVSWVAPTDMFIELGAEAFAGGKFPAGGEASSGSGSQVYFANFGGDFNASHSWQAGVSQYTADVTERESGGHSHGHGDEEEEVPAFTGDSDVTGFNMVYKWAPDGNYKNRHFKLQGEYFWRDEDGEVEMHGSDPLESSTYDGEQEGYYLQAVYQFMPQWRTGIRYDYLESDANGSDLDVLEEAGLTDEGIDPERWSAMLEWVPSEFSRIRLQYNRDESYEDSDDQIILQYTMSLGAHGAHSY